MIYRKSRSWCNIVILEIAKHLRAQKAVCIIKLIMKLVITTPEVLEEIIKFSVDNAIKDYYIKKESSVARKKNYTIKESSTELNVSILTVRNYIEKGYLKAFKIGNRILISNESLEKAASEVKSLRYKR